MFFWLLIIIHRRLIGDVLEWNWERGMRMAVTSGFAIAPFLHLYAINLFIYLFILFLQPTLHHSAPCFYFFVFHSFFLVRRNLSQNQNHGKIVPISRAWDSTHFCSNRKTFPVTTSLSKTCFLAKPPLPFSKSSSSTLFFLLFFFTLYFPPFS